MKRITIAATILSLNLASMSAAAQDKSIASHGAASLGRVTEREADLEIQSEPVDAQIQVRFSDDLNLDGVELDPELLKALADLERNRDLFEDPIFDPDYTRTHFASTSYSSSAGGGFALRLIPLGIGLIVLIVRATRRD